MKTKTAAALGIKRLYHYQSVEKPELLARIFTEGTLYFSNPKDFNDPWDCRPCYTKAILDTAGGYERVLQWFVRVSKKHGPALPDEEHAKREREVRANRRLLEHFIDEATRGMASAIESQYRIYCLTPHPDSALMWSHYARSHTGVCLEFSVMNMLFCAALPVEYLERYPSYDLADGDEDANLRPLLTKSSVWRYEDEFRLVVTEAPHVFPNVPTTKEGLLALPKGALQSIILGASTTTENRRLVQTLVERAGGRIVLKEATRVPDRYELEIRELV